MFSLDSWKRGQVANIFRAGFLKDDRNTVTTTNIYSHIEGYFRTSKYDDYYFSDEEPKESYSNNKPIPYNIFIDEEYEPHEYTEPRPGLSFIKFNERTGDYIDRQFSVVENFNNMTRLNLYGLLKESKEQITKLTKILTKLSSNETIRTRLTHLNIGENNLVIVNKTWTNRFNISYEISNNTRLIDLINRFQNLSELNVCNNKISNIDVIKLLISPKIVGQRQIPIINLANNLICKKGIFYMINGKNDVENFIPEIQKVIDVAIQNNKGLRYLNISENNLNPNEIILDIYKRKKTEIVDGSFSKLNVKNDYLRLELNNFFKFVAKEKLPTLDLSSINMRYELPITPVDDYVTNINIETYLKKYVGKDENGRDKDPIFILNDRGIVNYINALNDTKIGDRNLLIKRMSYEDRKMRLIDIINFHQIMMGLSVNEKKQLCNEMVAYNARVLEANEVDSTAVGVSVGQGFDPFSGFPFSFSLEKGYSFGFSVGDVEKGRHSPWTSYRVRKTDYGFPLQILATLLEKHDVSSFRFFERNQSLINKVVEGTNTVKFLCNFLEDVGGDFKELNLSNCSLSTNVFISISESIKKNPNINITHINLSYNDLTNDGVFYLCDLLKEKQSIRNINISDNINITNEGLAFVAEWLLTKDISIAAPVAGAGAEAVAPPLPVHFVYSFEMLNENLDNIEKCKNLRNSLGFNRDEIYNLKKIPQVMPLLTRTVFGITVARDGRDVRDGEQFQQLQVRQRIDRPPIPANQEQISLQALTFGLDSQTNLRNIIVQALREINNPPLRGGKIKRKIKRKNKTVKKGRRKNTYKKSTTYKRNKRVKNKNSNKNPQYKKPIKKSRTIRKK